MTRAWDKTPLCNRPGGIFIATGFSEKPSLGWLISHWVGLFLAGFLHPSVTDPLEPDPVDYFPLPSGNLVSPVPSEYFDFTRPFLCFPIDCLV